MDKKEVKRRDLILMVIFPLLAVIISLLIKANFLVSTILFFGVPAAYLSYRKKSLIKKTLIFSIIFSIPLTIFIDYLAVKNKAWFVPHSVFSFRLFGLIPIEDFIWGFLGVYLVVIFYEYFLDRRDEKRAKDYLHVLAIILSLLVLILFVFIFSNPDLLYIPYIYLWLGLVLFLLPLLTTVSFFPRLFSKYVKAISYFFALFILLELTGVHLNQWVFPGEFIGWVELFGIKFPFEEFFFFIILGSAVILSYYEVFADDRK